MAEPLNPLLLMRVDELELSVRSLNSLQNTGIDTIQQLVQYTEADLLGTASFGRKSLQEIREVLGDMGLSLKMDVQA